MKTTAKITRRQTKCGVKTVKGATSHGRPKDWERSDFWRTEQKGHGTLDELERRLAAI